MAMFERTLPGVSAPLPGRLPGGVGGVGSRPSWLSRFGAAPVPRRARRRLSTGYSLVELAIVLAAGGLLAAGPLLLVHNRAAVDTEESARRQLEIAAQAVVDYAATHRTVARSVSVNGGRPAWIPDGRPHLPCPDRDGDGHEDRAGAAVDASFDVFVSPSGSVSGRPGESSGECAVSTGWLPHETLNLPATDPWGNLLVYRVDLVLSNPLVGIDSRSRANSYDLSAPLRLGDDGAGNARLELPALSERAARASARGFHMPPLVCVGHPEDEDDAVCAVGEFAGVVLGAGESATVSGPHDGMETVHTRAGDDLALAAVDVPAFAVLSAGRDLSGPLLSRSALIDEGKDSACRAREPRAAGASWGDLHNYRVLRESVCNNRGESPVLYAPPRPRHSVGTARTSPPQEARADDQVVWMAAGEVAAALERAGSLPARAYPPVAPDDVAAADLGGLAPLRVRFPEVVEKPAGLPATLTVSINRAPDTAAGEGPHILTVSVPADPPGVVVTDPATGASCAATSSPCEFPIVGTTPLAVNGLGDTDTVTLTVDGEAVVVRPPAPDIPGAVPGGDVTMTVAAGVDHTINVVLSRPLAPGEDPATLTLTLPDGLSRVSGPDGTVCPAGPIDCELLFGDAGDIIVRKADNRPVVITAVSEGVNATLTLVPPALDVVVPPSVEVPVGTDTTVDIALSRALIAGDDPVGVTVVMPAGDYRLEVDGAPCPAPPGRCVTQASAPFEIVANKSDNAPVALTVNGRELVLGPAPRTVTATGLSETGAVLPINSRNVDAGGVEITLEPGSVPGVDRIQVSISFSGGFSNENDGFGFNFGDGTILGQCRDTFGGIRFTLVATATCPVPIPSGVTGGVWSASLFEHATWNVAGRTMTITLGGQEFTLETEAPMPLRLAVQRELTLALGDTGELPLAFSRPEVSGDTRPGVTLMLPDGSNLTVSQMIAGRSFECFSPAAGDREAPCFLGGINDGPLTVTRGAGAPDGDPPYTFVVTGETVTLVDPAGRPPEIVLPDGREFWWASSPGDTQAVVTLTVGLSRPFVSGVDDTVTLTAEFDDTDIGLTGCGTPPCEVDVAGDTPLELTLRTALDAAHEITLGGEVLTVGRAAPLTLSPRPDPTRVTLTVGEPAPLSLALDLGSAARPGADVVAVSVELNGASWGNVFDTGADFVIREGAGGASPLKDTCNLNERGTTDAAIQGSLNAGGTCTVEVPRGLGSEWAIADLIGDIEFNTAGITLVFDFDAADTVGGDRRLTVVSQ